MFDLNTKYFHATTCEFHIRELKDLGLDIDVFGFLKGEVKPEHICRVNCLFEGLGMDMIAVKDYSENAGLMDELLRLGIISKPSWYISSGFVRIPVCRVNLAELKKHTAVKKGA